MLRHKFRAKSSSHRLQRATQLGSSLLLALSLGAVGSCKKAEADPVGFGIYQIGKSTPDDGYVCRPQNDQTYCSNNPSPRIADHKTQTDLFFRGHEANAPLVEILVGVWNCQPGKVRVDLGAKMGDPTQVSGKNAYWRLKKMTVIALLPRPEKHDLCTVHFLDHSETSRIAELFPDVQL